MKSYWLVFTTAFLVLAGPLAVPGEIGVSVVFTDKEISVIRAYYRDHGAGYSSKDKGKRKKSLPPGIARNLQRGKPLPPGIAKQVLPTGLIGLLTPPPHGYQRVVIDGRVLLVEIATQLIHDVLEDLVLH